MDRDDAPAKEVTETQDPTYDFAPEAVEKQDRTVDSPPKDSNDRFPLLTDEIVVNAVSSLDTGRDSKELVSPPNTARGSTEPDGIACRQSEPSLKKIFAEAMKSPSASPSSASADSLPDAPTMTVDAQKYRKMEEELRGLTEENKTLRGRVQKFSRMLEKKVKVDAGVQACGNPIDVGVQACVNPIERAVEALKQGMREDTGMHIQVLLRSELPFPVCKQVVEACVPLLTSGMTVVVPLICVCAEAHDLPFPLLQQVANACLHGCSRVPGTIQVLVLCGPALERDLLEATLELCFEALLTGEAPFAAQLIALYAPRTVHTLEQLEHAMDTTRQSCTEKAYVQCLTEELIERSLQSRFGHLCLQRSDLVRISPALIRFLDTEYMSLAEPIVRKALEEPAVVLQCLETTEVAVLWECLVKVMRERQDLCMVACSEVCQKDLLSSNLISSFCRYLGQKPESLECALEFMSRLLSHWEATVVATHKSELSVPQALAEGGAVDTLVDIIVSPRPVAERPIYTLALSVLKQLFQLNAPASVLALKHFSSLDVIVQCVIDTLQTDLQAYPDLQRQVLNYAITSFRQSPGLESKLINAVGFITRQDCSLVTFVLDRPKEAARAIRLEALRSVDSTCTADGDAMRQLCRCLVRLLNEADVIVQHSLQAILNLIQSDATALGYIITSLGGSPDKETARDKSVQNIMRVTHRFQKSELIISKAQQLLDQVLCDGSL